MAYCNVFDTFGFWHLWFLTPLVFDTFGFWHLWFVEPEKQFALVERHVKRIKSSSQFLLSEIIIMVERNPKHQPPSVRTLPKHRVCDSCVCCDSNCLTPISAAQMQNAASFKRSKLQAQQASSAASFKRSKLQAQQASSAASFKRSKLQVWGKLHLKP